MDDHCIEIDPKDIFFSGGTKKLPFCGGHLIINPERVAKKAKETNLTGSLLSRLLDVYFPGIEASKSFFELVSLLDSRPVNTDLLHRLVFEFRKKGYLVDVDIPGCPVDENYSYRSHETGLNLFELKRLAEQEAKFNAYLGPYAQDYGLLYLSGKIYLKSEKGFSYVQINSFYVAYINESDRLVLGNSLTFALPSQI